MPTLLERLLSALNDTRTGLEVLASLPDVGKGEQVLCTLSVLAQRLHAYLYMFERETERLLEDHAALHRMVTYRREYCENFHRKLPERLIEIQAMRAIFKEVANTELGDNVPIRVPTFLISSSQEASGGWNTYVFSHAREWNCSLG